MTTTISRPWGEITQVALNELCSIHLLEFRPGARFSLHRHRDRTETFWVLRGTFRATIGDAVSDLSVGESISVPHGALHRLEAGALGGLVLELAFGTYDMDGDVVRLVDDYGRVTSVPDPLGT